MDISQGSATTFGAAALAVALRGARDDGERLLLVREFVRGAQDDAASPADVDALVAEDPATTGDRRWDAVVAGAAEWVASRIGSAPAPSWVDQPGRFLDQWFQVEQSGRAGAVAHAPAAFRRRGVLIDPSSLVSDGLAL